MNESEATSKLIRRINKLGDVFLVKITASHISNTGIPDILGSIHGSAVAIECKAIPDSTRIININVLLTKKQNWTLRQFRGARARAYVGLYFKDLQVWRFVDIDDIEDKMKFQTIYKNSYGIAGLLER